MAYGFATVSTATPSCCSCYLLTFTSGPIVGKQIIVQAVNVNSNVAVNQFAIAIPGGGYGLNDGCINEWGANSTVWGAQFGGIASNTCDQFPGSLQGGCNFRWDYMQGADNPNADYFEVTCPAALVSKSGCTPACCIPGGPSAVPTFSIPPPGSPAQAAPNGPPPEPQGVFITSAGYYSFQPAPVRRSATPVASLAAVNSAPLR
ncbi:MAG: glycoside hydrolase family 45 [Lasallia pustulata]|uniref:cellulase n=1 Tax=Lasallia pustulata TaxID=136370 RepID=A0A1W5CZP5_9LECA|nr:MAG: glycoside hydrolase family 45 [Lasallia pustulata]SLM36109.1 RlpA-like double-psi beta-barrel domain [Lasallia pustulata]